MTKVTNNSDRPLEFHVAGGAKGSPKYAVVRPGETEDLTLADRNSAVNRGREIAGVVTIADKAGREVARATTEATSARADKTPSPP